MRRFIAGSALAALLVPAIAVGRPTDYHRPLLHGRSSAACVKAKADRGKVIRKFGARAPGRDICGLGVQVRYGVRPASSSEERAYLGALERMLAPPPVAAPTALGTAVPSSGGSVGSCPAVIPGYIIQAESGGNPNAQNPSGAFGCYQLMPEHFGAGGACAGMSTDMAGQEACASKLWDGGAGVSNWAQTA